MKRKCFCCRLEELNVENSNVNRSPETVYVASFPPPAPTGEARPEEQLPWNFQRVSDLAGRRIQELFWSDGLPISMAAMKMERPTKNGFGSHLIVGGAGPLLVLSGLIAGPVLSAQPAHPALIKSEFIFERSAFPANHASTIVETRDGLLAAWFSGPEPRHPEVSIWSARHNGTNWSVPVEVVIGRDEERRRSQCWNPVLFQGVKGPLLLFYKVGPSPEKWWGMSMISTNEGKTWSNPTRLPDGFIGPVRNKPIELPDGSLLCGASSEEGNWTIHMERRFPKGERWEKSSVLNQPAQWAAIQPAILRHDARTVQILCRTKQQAIVECWSGDGGKTWADPHRSGIGG